MSLLVEILCHLIRLKTDHTEFMVLAFEILGEGAYPAEYLPG